jgi:hypothetical protein
MIPWLQAEADSFLERHNNTAKRADRKKVLPAGVPNYIQANPQEFDALDFKASILHPSKALTDLSSPR